MRPSIAGTALYSDGSSILTRNDRFSVLLVVTVAIAGLALGLTIREQTITQTWTYESRTEGISARYPAGWLLDERSGTVVRILDPKARPYKTQYTITVIPLSGQASIRNVLDGLTLQRSSDLAAYRVLGVTQVTARGTRLTQMTFAFVDADPNPFVQRLPVVVLGEDTVIVDGNRAIVVTFMAGQATFEAERPAYDRFFASIRY